MERLHSRYNDSLPVISFHVPKTAGKSLEKILASWFAKEYLRHVFDRRLNRMPIRHQLLPRSCIHGHFVPGMEMGIEQYYPEARQWITFIRDPITIVTSLYYYQMKVDIPGIPKPKVAIDKFLLDYAEQGKDPYFRFWPQELEDIEAGAVADKFLFIDVTEEMTISVDNLAFVLGKPKVHVPHINVSEKYLPPSKLRAIYRQTYSKHYELHELARNRIRNSYSSA